MYEIDRKKVPHLNRTATVSLALCLALQLTACASAVSTAPVTASTADSSPETVSTDTEYSSELFAMDTYMTFKAYGTGAEAALQDISSMITGLDQQLSVTNSESEIYRLNHAGGQPVTLSEDTGALLKRALALGKSTGGALALTSYPLSLAWGFTTGEYQIPGQSELDKLLPLVDDSKITLDGTTAALPEGAELDLGSVAKGYAGDQAAALLEDAGITSALLNLGSSTIRAIGAKPDGSAWRIAIQDPNDTASYAGVVSVTDCAIDTSGGYERYFEGDDGEIYWHILNPETGYPAKGGLTSVTILSDSALTGDGLSTALFVMGLDKAISYWQENGGFDFILLTEDGEIYLTEAAQDCFSPLGSYENAAIHIVTQQAGAS